MKGRPRGRRRVRRHDSSSRIGLARRARRAALDQLGAAREAGGGRTASEEAMRRPPRGSSARGRDTQTTESESRQRRWRRSSSAKSARSPGYLRAATASRSSTAGSRYPSASTIPPERLSARAPASTKTPAPSSTLRRIAVGRAIAAAKHSAAPLRAAALTMFAAGAGVSPGELSGSTSPPGSPYGAIGSSTLESWPGPWSSVIVPPSSWPRTGSEGTSENVFAVPIVSRRRSPALTIADVG